MIGVPGAGTGRPAMDRSALVAHCHSVALAFISMAPKTGFQILLLVPGWGALSAHLTGFLN